MLSLRIFVIAACTLAGAAVLAPLPWHVGFVRPIPVLAAPPGVLAGGQASGAPDSELGQTGHGEIAAVVRGLLEHGDGPESDRADLVALYGAAGGGTVQPLWLDGGGVPNVDARAALGILDAAPDDGLNRSDYDVPRLAGLVSALAARPEGAGAAIVYAETAARFDVTLSSAALRYLRHAHRGRVDPRRIGFDLHVPNDYHDFAALLRAAVAEHRVAALFEAYRPPLAEYQGLRTALAQYRAMPADAWRQVPQPLGRSVRKGDRYDGAPLVRRRLGATGDLVRSGPEASDSGLYDAALAAAVQRYQARHGLDADGVIGPATLASFNVPLAWRVRQLELALERQRWLPHLGSRRLVVINIPMFTLWAWDAIPPRGAPAFTTSVIVGRALAHETPVFASQIREVVFQPYWNVPTSILRRETLPAMARDPEYLQKQDMEIVLGQGDDAQPVPLTSENVAALRRGTLRVRQRPGPRNALGQIKFVFPSEEDVYMHGTPARELFNRYRRDFSHGCVRVADPIGLAEWVLAGQSDWDRSRIGAATTQEPSSRHVPLARPAEVVLFYATAAVSPEDGSVRFADDIYRQDARLDRALADPVSTNP